MTADPTTIFRRWIEEAWAGDGAATRDLVTDDFVGHWPDRDVHGPDALVDAIAEGYAMFPDMTIAVALGPFVDGDIISGRWQGEASGPDGGTVRFVGNDILRLRDGRIAEYWNAAATTMTDG